jgi:protein TonB
MKKLILIPLLVLSLCSAKAQNTSPPDVGDLDIKETVDSSKLAPINPEFPGGLDKFYSYIRKNFKMPYFPDGARSSVTVSFVIDADGSVTDVKIVKGLTYSINKEAVRVVSQSPKWRLGILHGEAVKVNYSCVIPIPLN